MKRVVNTILGLLLCFCPTYASHFIPTPDAFLLCNYNLSCAVRPEPGDRIGISNGMSVFCQGTRHVRCKCGSPIRSRPRYTYITARCRTRALTHRADSWLGTGSSLLPRFPSRHSAPQFLWSLESFYHEGDIMKAKPKHFVPRPEGAGNVGQHPVIILSPPDLHGYVLVAPMSHNHPDGTPTRRASRYGLPVDPIKGESQVNVGYPKLIHQDNLRPNKPHAAMHYQDYLALKCDIIKFSQQYR